MIKKNNPPAFQFYPKDFISDMNVMMMTNEEVGVYIKMICLVWLEDGIPDDSGKIQRLCNHPSTTLPTKEQGSEEWENIFSKVRTCFYEKKEKLFHKRLDVEKKKQKEWRKKSRAGGLLSAEKRRRKRIDENGARVVEPPHQPKGNSSSSSSSSFSSSNKQEKETMSGKPDAMSEFESFWEIYPRKASKQDAFVKWKNLKKTQQKEIMEAVPNYRKEIEILKTETRYIKHPATFLHPERERWKDYLPENWKEPTPGGKAKKPSEMTPEEYTAYQDSFFKENK